MISLDDKKGCESECETESDSVDSIFDGIDEENLKSSMRKLAAGFSAQTGQQEKEEVDRTRQAIKVSCNAIDITDKEIKWIIDLCKRHNMNLEESLANDGVSFIEVMREMMLDEQVSVQVSNRGEVCTTKSVSMDVNSGDEEYLPEMGTRNRMRNKQKKTKKSEKEKAELNLKRESGYNLDGSKRAKRILLNDALKTKDTSMEGWSDARKKAYKAIKKNPNSYHYRFNKPGELQRNGAWTKLEHNLFMQNLLDVGANKDWGRFSINLQGRVGYQCSNYYRQLVKDGNVWDPNYWYDGEKLQFKRDRNRSMKWLKYAFTVLQDPSGVFGKLPAQHPKRPADLPSPEDVAVIAAKGHPKDPPDGFKRKGERVPACKSSRKRKATSVCNRKTKSIKTSTKSDIESDDNDVAYPTTKAVVQEYSPTVSMPKFVDPFTNSEIKTPAISPYGHVCEYDSWTKILRTPGAKDICPFTRNPVTRRQLVKLCKENIDEFMGKILNQEKALEQWRAMKGNKIQ